MQRRHSALSLRDQAEPRPRRNGRRRHARRFAGYARGIHRDRAAIVTTAILQIVDTTIPEQMRPALEGFLRDEFARAPD
jgi:hypothetical protein